MHRIPQAAHELAATLAAGDLTRSTYPVHVYEYDRGRWEQFDLFSRLLKDNIIFLGREITDDVANFVAAQMLFLEAQDPDKEISIYINSPGGSVTAGLAIFDTMRFIRNDVTTICIGQAASMAAVLLAAGSKGKRMALPNSRIMIHQPLGGFSGQASDIDIQAREILRFKVLLNGILAECCGKDPEQVEKDSDRDFIMTAPVAREYGLIDKVVENRKKVPGLA